MKRFLTVISLIICLSVCNSCSGLEEKNTDPLHDTSWRADWAERYGLESTYKAWALYMFYSDNTFEYTTNALNEPNYRGTFSKKSEGEYTLSPSNQTAREFHVAGNTMYFTDKPSRLFNKQ